MTKQDYIKKHPKSILANELRCNDWADDAPVKIISGLDTRFDKRSNLYKALQNTSGKYERGGHLQRGTEGWWFAIKI